MYLFNFFIVVSTFLHLNKARFAEYNPPSDDNQPTCLSCQLLNHSQLARVTMAQVVLFSLPAQVGLTLHCTGGVNTGYCTAGGHLGGCSTRDPSPRGRR